MTAAYRPSDEFEGLLNAVCEEGLTDGQARRLEQIVEDSDDDCRYYLMYVQLHGSSTWNTAPRAGFRGPDFPAEIGRRDARAGPGRRDARAGQPPTGCIRTALAGRTAGWPSLLNPPLAFQRLLSYALAALVLGIGVLGGRGMVAGRARLARMVRGRWPPRRDSPAEAVARIIGARDCRWADSQTAVAVGERWLSDRKFSWRREPWRSPTAWAIE